jgi:hypothetical protein
VRWMVLHRPVELAAVPGQVGFSTKMSSLPTCPKTPKSELL